MPSEGLFTEGCFALVEGDYTEDATLLVIAIGHPPCESREGARSIFGHVDFLGRGATTLLEDVSSIGKDDCNCRLCTDMHTETIFQSRTARTPGPQILRALRCMARQTRYPSRPTEDVRQLYGEQLHSEDHRSLWELH